MSRACAALLLYGAWVFSLDAAQIATESFTGGSNGWTGTIGGLDPSGEWAFAGNAAAVTFWDSGMGFITTGELKPGPGASAGAFTGNYDAAGIGVIGLRFQSLNPNFDNAQPTANVDHVTLRWWGTNASFFRIFTAPATGVWYTFAASLASPALGRWALASGSVTNFEAARQSITNVMITVSRRGDLEQTYLFDDLFVDGLPAAVALQQTGATHLITWTPLRSNETYRLEASESPASGWTNLGTLTATGATHVTQEPATHAARLYRLILE